MARFCTQNDGRPFDFPAPQGSLRIRGTVAPVAAAIKGDFYTHGAPWGKRAVKFPLESKIRRRQSVPELVQLSYSYEFHHKWFVQSGRTARNGGVASPLKWVRDWRMVIGKAWHHIYYILCSRINHTQATVVLFFTKKLLTVLSSRDKRKVGGISGISTGRLRAQVMQSSQPRSLVVTRYLQPSAMTSIPLPSFP